jgi:hypothetical protein
MKKKDAGKRTVTAWLGGSVVVIIQHDGTEKGFDFDVKVSDDPRRKVIEYLRENKLKPSMGAIRMFPWLMEATGNPENPHCDECEAEITNLTEMVVVYGEEVGYFTFCDKGCRQEFLND